MKVRVGLNGALSDEMPVDNWDQQGEISAPTLFNIYIAIVFLLPFF